MGRRPRNTKAQACVWLVLSLVLSLGGAAHADAPAQGEPVQSASEPAAYLETVDDALREFAAHNYEEARALFAKAHALNPNARTERGLGLAQFELRNYGDSIQHFEASLRSSVKPLTPALKADTEQMLARANNFVARVHLDTKPSVSKVVLDGLPIEVPAGQILWLQVGDHSLEVQVPGFAPEKRKLSVVGGEERTLTIILSRSAATTPAAAEEKHWYKSPWLWTSVGAVLAGAAAGTAYALTRPAESPHPYGGTADALLRGP